ncbi:MAG: DNA polymerase III subunit chi [Gammaproteobacteria bacterium]|nr:DNA polymerase III subunit chi [Gammaproteobacteria bacterium]
MTRVDFYVQPEDSADGPLMTACRLCEKAVGSGKRVYVFMTDPALADDFDRLLWTFKQGSFIAHERLAGPPQPPLPAVLLGDAQPPAGYADVLINLAPEAPAFAGRFERVLEIVYGDAATRAKSRERFKHYRDAGFALETHKL